MQHTISPVQETLPAEETRTEQMRMYCVRYSFVYEDHLGHYPYAHSFGFSSDEGAVRWASEFIKDEADLTESVVRIFDASLVEVRPMPRLPSGGSVVMQEILVATLGPDRQFTLHR